MQRTTVAYSAQYLIEFLEVLAQGTPYRADARLRLLLSNAGRPLENVAGTLLTSYEQEVSRTMRDDYLSFAVTEDNFKLVKGSKTRNSRKETIDYAKKLPTFADWLNAEVYGTAVATLVASLRSRQGKEAALKALREYLHENVVGAAPVEALDGPVEACLLAVGTEREVELAARLGRALFEHCEFKRKSEMEGVPGRTAAPAAEPTTAPAKAASGPAATAAGPATAPAPPPSAGTLASAPVPAPFCLRAVKPLLIAGKKPVLGLRGWDDAEFLAAAVPAAVAAALPQGAARLDRALTGTLTPEERQAVLDTLAENPLVPERWERGLASAPGFDAAAAWDALDAACAGTPSVRAAIARAASGDPARLCALLCACALVGEEAARDVVRLWPARLS